MFVRKSVDYITEIKILSHFVTYLTYQSEIEDR